MSLVNNMLRDLDQRRKESDNSGSGVSLMPASEYPKEARKNLLPLLLVGLGLVVVALVYYWTTLTQSGVDRRLDIPIAAADTRPQPNDERTTQETVQETVQALEEPIVVAVPAEAEVEAVAEVEGEAREIASEATIEEATIEEATIEEATIEKATIEVAISSPEVGIGESLPIERVEQVSTAVESNPLADPVVVTEAPVTSQPIDQPVEVPVPTEQPTSIAELDLGEDVQLKSMKEAPRYSNEQLDTIAVQEALRLISAGNTEAAFDTLGQYIIENRNAHQSRETYAKLLMNQGRGNDAAALIDAGLDLAPNHSGFKKVKARLLMGSGNIPDAVDILISRAPDIVDDSEYHDLLASAQLSSRDFAGAVISYRGLVEYDQSQGKWWYGYAAANDQLGNTSIARQAYSRAMQFSNLSANLRRRSQERVGTLNP